MSSTFLIDPRHLADAICEAQCLDFSQLSRIAARLTSVYKVNSPSRALRRRLASALESIVSRRECVVRIAHAWQPRSHWRVLYCSRTERERARSSVFGSRQRHFDQLRNLGREIGRDLGAQWERTKCTLPIEVYIGSDSAERLEHGGPKGRRLSARLILSEFWLLLNGVALAQAPVSRRAEFLPPSVASRCGHISASLSESHVLAETAVIRDTRGLTVAYSLVPSADERDAACIERLFEEALRQSQTGENDFVILGPCVSKKGKR